MYKIMLADDEGIVIDALKFIIEKEFGDICQVEHAKTGRSVIELAENFRPDIAIMDIQMPGINGIEAMKEIRESNPNMIFIVMSAYDKFDYAKEAIRLGVLEYITKPMERNRIVNVLKQAMGIVDRERQKRKNELETKEKLETVVPILESGLIYNILFQEHFEEDIESYKTLLGISEKHGYMLAVVYGETQEGNHMTNAVGSSVKIQNHYREIREDLKEYFSGVIGGIMGNKIAVLVPYEHENMDYNERISLIEKAREAARAMRKHSDISFRIGIGDVQEISALAESYNKAVRALTITTSSVAHVDDLSLSCEYEENYPIHLEKELFAEVEKGNVEQAIEVARRFFDWMVEYKQNNPMDVRLKTLEFVLWAEHISYEKSGMIYQFNSRNDYLQAVMEGNDFSALREWFVTKIRVACQNISGKRREKSNCMVEMAKEYIDGHYSKDISLDDVSRIVNISPYYFSKIFKDETGVNFIEYLTGIRIEKAKELLSTAEYSMKEICVMVGYTDPNYFSRSFKKNVGVTPTEYREGGVSV